MKVDGKIQALNNAIREAIPHMQKVSEDNPNADILIRAIKFSDGAEWHIGQPVKIKDFKWTDLTADGETYMGKALSLIAEQVQMLPSRGLPPVLVLISDGQPTDDFDKGLKALLDQPWGKKSVRIAIAIGDDADLGVLQKFIGSTDKRPYKANDPDAIVREIKLRSTVALKESAAFKETPVIRAQAKQASDDVW